MGHTAATLAETPVGAGYKHTMGVIAVTSVDDTIHGKHACTQAPRCPVFELKPRVGFVGIDNALTLVYLRQNYRVALHFVNPSTTHLVPQ